MTERTNALSERNSLQKTAKTVLLSLAVAGLMASCGPTGGIKQITETRTVSAPRQPMPIAASSAERFGYRQEEPQASPHARAEEEPAALEWEAPANWQKRPAGGMRLADFAVGPDGEAECYAILLQGDGGGLAANINRWRAQMGQEPMSEEAIGALPQLEMLGRAATFVEITGDYSGMMGETGSDYVMLGLVCEMETSSLFIKMVGPEPIVRGEVEPFKAFCLSFRVAGDLTP